MSGIHTVATASLLAGCLALVACGGGGGGTPTPPVSTSQASIDWDNADVLSEASTEASIMLIDGGDLGDDLLGGLPVAVTSTSSAELATRLGLELGTRLNALSIATGATVEDVSEICDGGGTATISHTETDFTLSFNHCTIEDMTVNGTVSVTASNDGDSFTMQFEDITVQYDGETHLFSMTMACTGLQTDSPSCVYSSEFDGTHGTYRIEDATLSGDYFTGYSVSARVYVGEYGYVDISTGEPIRFDEACELDVPSSGSLYLQGSGGTSASVSYEGCTQFQVCIDSDCALYSW